MLIKISKYRISTVPLISKVQHFNFFARMPRSKRESTAVLPPPNRWRKGWCGWCGHCNHHYGYMFWDARAIDMWVVVTRDDACKTLTFPGTPSPRQKHSVWKGNGCKMNFLIPGHRPRPLSYPPIVVRERGFGHELETPPRTTDELIFLVYGSGVGTRAPPTELVS